MTHAKPPADAIAQGGPMDGAYLGESDAEEFQVTMADLSRHRYVRSELRDERGLVYTYSGRL